MSFVSVLANSDFISVVADGRVTANEVEVIEEDYIKYKMISKNQFIAFAGSQLPCEEVVSQVEYYDDKYYDLEQLANEIHRVIYNQPHLEAFKILIIVGGLNFDSQITFYTVNHYEEIKQYTPSDNVNLKYAFLINAARQDVDMNSIAENKLFEIANKMKKKKQTINTPNKFHRVQKELNNFIADMDITVNKKTNHLLIKK